MEFKAVDHINVRVADLKESIKFYTDVLGFEYVGQRDLRPASPTTSAYVRLGEVVVELAEGHKMSDYSTAGMINHFGLTVSSIQEAYDYLKKAGVTPTCDPINVNDCFYCFFFEGPSGEKFEVLEYLK